MQDQILEILTKERLSSSQFADRIGVQRSSVSHVLSGRNKPGFDFIQKILVAFPDINGDWLITGSGDMYKKKSPSEGLFETNNEMQKAENLERTERKPVTLNIMKPEKEDVKVPKTREIDRIIIFYTDRTFREYDAEP
jgi:transcriptional regulator with XRE-family HTH domain